MVDHYVGLDVSQKQTSICVIDGDGKIIVEGKSLTRPMDIFGWIKNRIDPARPVKVCLEAGNMSAWRHGGLLRRCPSSPDHNRYWRLDARGQVLEDRF